LISAHEYRSGRQCPVMLSRGARLVIILWGSCHVKRERTLGVRIDNGRAADSMPTGPVVGQGSCAAVANEGPVGASQQTWAGHPQEAGIEASSQMPQPCCWVRVSVPA